MPTYLEDYGWARLRSLARGGPVLVIRMCSKVYLPPMMSSSVTEFSGAGSCGLEYNLHRNNPSLANDDPQLPSSPGPFILHHSPV